MGRGGGKDSKGVGESKLGRRRRIKKMGMGMREGNGRKDGVSFE